VELAAKARILFFLRQRFVECVQPISKFATSFRDGSKNAAGARIEESAYVHLQGEAESKWNFGISQPARRSRDPLTLADRADLFFHQISPTLVVRLGALMSTHENQINSSRACGRRRVP
jgi:hypothetical protein